MTATSPSVLPPARGVVRAVPPYVAGRRASTAATAALASNESHYPPLPSVLEEVARAAAELHRYPDNGALELREHLAAALGVSTGQVVVGAGSTGVLQQTITAHCDAGDEVVFAWRSFELYPLLVQLAGAVPVPVPLDPLDRHDLTAMAAAVTERTRVVLVCNPNNPTGTALSCAELESFLAAVPPHVLVVLDEAYLEYSSAGPTEAIELLHRHPNVCIVRTFSKAHGLAGLRVGYAVAAEPVADALRRAGMPFTVSALAQRAAIASLAAGDELRERVALVRSERARLLTALRELGFAAPDSETNFVWLRLGDADRERALELLAADDILARGFAGDGLRITLADPATNDRVLASLTRFASEPAPAGAR
ncbi:histidinol-phosphate transaminase [Herbiconiux sp. CPCC 203407]|uniref:Aromatic amino acid aminotransferase n=1 Tax=Herbiconiux oxytropis TaxID=2970915 RepID=A0AA41XBT0_9MICO|nr:histidinol-phosphate transaminase [Herbiconiux oxytropis]MCS5723151.1 histidinol-phosphate transaminase [Herbiconiux oxytropis]MCS5725292.1 histidinol-phosphate transaminase [Herbiconiux oxytropis]